MTIDRPEDAARHDTGDVLAGGEVGIIREHANQLASDPPNAGDGLESARVAARPQDGGSASATSAPQAPTAGPARTAVPGRR